MRFGHFVERFASLAAVAVVSVAAVPVVVQFAVDHSWRVHSRANSVR